MNALKHRLALRSPIGYNHASWRCITDMLGLINSIVLVVLARELTELLGRIQGAILTTRNKSSSSVVTIQHFVTVTVTPRPGSFSHESCMTHYVAGTTVRSVSRPVAAKKYATPKHCWSC